MEKHHIWDGVLQWNQLTGEDKITVTSEIKCQVFTKDKNDGPEVTATGWPASLVLHLMSTEGVHRFGPSHFKDNRTVLVSVEPSDAATKLTTLMQSGQWAGFVELKGAETERVESECPIQLLLLVYSSFRHAYLGIIPKDQVAFVNRLKELVEEGSLEPGTGLTNSRCTDNERVGRIDELLQRLSTLSLDHNTLTRLKSS